MPLPFWRLSQGTLAPESQSETQPDNVAVACQQVAPSLQYRYRNRNRHMAGRIDEQIRRHWCYKLDGGNTAVFETRGRVPVVFRIESFSIAGEAWNGHGFLVLSCRGGSITCKDLTLPR
jgi:hypothetical protein